MAMTLVETVTVGSGGAASIEFTNIPQTGKDLLIVASTRDTEALAGINLQLNGDTGNNVTRRTLRGTGSAANSTSGTLDGIYDIPQGASSSTANTFSNVAIYCANYTSTGNKSFSVDGVNEDNSTVARQLLAAASYSTSSPLTSVKFRTNTAFAQHSTASLYIIS